MIFSLRPFLVTFLVLLQFIAPLVHAHTSEKILSQGLHIPGLEVYAHSEPQDALNSIQSATTLLCKVSLFCSNIEGQIVGIDAGFSRDIAIPMQRLYKKIVDLDHDYYLPQQPVIFKTVISAFNITLLIQAIPLVCQLANSSHPPRAPPAQALLSYLKSV
jgi:hypothetical protein